MGTLSTLQDVNIWAYVVPLLIFTIFLLFILIKRQREEQAMTHMVARLMNRHALTKQQIESYENLGRHHQLILLNEALFIMGLLFFAISYIKNDWVVFGIGFVVMMVTLYLLRLILTHPARKPSQHLLNVFEGQDMHGQETALVKHVDALLHKEKILQLKERELGKQLEMLYQMATTIDHKETQQRSVQRSSQNNIDVDVKKVLLVLDDLLEKLPDEEVAKFVESPDYELYKKVMGRMK